MTRRYTTSAPASRSRPRPCANPLRSSRTGSIIIRDLQRGLIDFPALRDGREVYLCWLYGEERIDFWHEFDTGFAGRQPL